MKCIGLSVIFLVGAQLSAALFVPESHGLLARQVSLPELLPVFGTLIITCLLTQGNNRFGDRLKGGNNNQTNGTNKNGGNNNTTVNGQNNGNGNQDGNPQTSLSESLPY